MAFLTVPELAAKYKCREYHMRRAVAGWIRTGDLQEPIHFTRRASKGRYPREFSERVIAILIVRDRNKKNCHNAFVDGYELLMAALK